MPGPLDAPLRKVATVAITKMGRPVTLRDVTRGEYSAGHVPETSADRPVRAIVSAFPKETQRGGERITNEGVRAGDLLVLVAAPDVEPNPPVGLQDTGNDGKRKSFWVIDGQVWETVKVDPETANEQVVTYQCQVRR